MEKQLPKISWHQISEIKLPKDNPRKIDRNQFEKLVKNIEENPGFFHARPCLLKLEWEKVVPKGGTTSANKPVLVVFAGTQRLRAAKKLGWKEVPGIMFDSITDEEQHKYALLDNLHHGEFDFDMLANLYDIDELLSLGMQEKDLQLDLSDGDPIPKSEDEPQKCPSCGQKIKAKK